MVESLEVDVLVVGAGLSGIDAGYRLQTRCPDQSYLILEGRESLGGTWDLFRYPGVRSDSDMFTLGFPFRPWTSAPAIADAASILKYLRDTAADYGIDQHIRFGHRVVAASWSSQKSRWTVEVQVGPEVTRYSCRFLYLCCGYYRYDAGHQVDFPDADSFLGTVVHPQQWPESLDYTGRRVVVIGSGATAMTVVPAMAGRAAHVTLVQRSPSYILSAPSRDVFADVVRKALPERAAHRVVRAKSVLVSTVGYQLCRRWPQAMAAYLRRGVAKELAGSVAVDPHFTPQYHPWDQRVCLVPDADLFRALRNGSAGIVTGEIESFTPRGIRLASGETLDADIIVTATGLRMQALGGIRVEVDGEHVDPGRRLSYKGMMLDGVPNLAWCVGYVNNSWTLRADLTSLYVCRLLRYMARHGWAECRPVAAAEDGTESRPILDLTSGYVQRAAGLLPGQGARAPWKLRQNYPLDFFDMRMRRVDDGVIRFRRAQRPAVTSA